MATPCPMRCRCAPVWYPRLGGYRDLSQGSGARGAGLCPGRRPGIVSHFVPTGRVIKYLTKMQFFGVPGGPPSGGPPGPLLRGGTPPIGGYPLWGPSGPPDPTHFPRPGAPKGAPNRASYGLRPLPWEGGPGTPREGVPGAPGGPPGRGAPGGPPGAPARPRAPGGPGGSWGGPGGGSWRGVWRGA